MSTWTHIVATIDIDTRIEDKNIKEIIENKLQYAPRITGSEGDADIFINVLSGYNTSTNRKERYQTRIVITIVGDLRDRMKEQTRKEYSSFYKYIKNTCRFSIRNKTVKILGY